MNLKNAESPRREVVLVSQRRQEIIRGIIGTYPHFNMPSKILQETSITELLNESGCTHPLNPKQYKHNNGLIFVANPLILYAHSEEPVSYEGKGEFFDTQDIDLAFDVDPKYFNGNESKQKQFLKDVDNNLASVVDVDYRLLHGLELIGKGVRRNKVTNQTFYTCHDASLVGRMFSSVDKTPAELFALIGVDVPSVYSFNNVNAKRRRNLY